MFPLSISSERRSRLSSTLPLRLNLADFEVTETRASKPDAIGFLPANVRFNPWPKLLGSLMISLRCLGSHIIARTSIDNGAKKFTTAIVPGSSSMFFQTHPYCVIRMRGGIMVSALDFGFGGAGRVLAVN